jgi:hypothetical protein
MYLKVIFAGSRYFRSAMFDVTIFRLPERWEWQVCNRKGAIVMQAWEQTLKEAKYKANRALFLLLSVGWYNSD